MNLFLRKAIRCEKIQILENWKHTYTGVGKYIIFLPVESGFSVKKSAFLVFEKRR